MGFMGTGKSIVGRRLAIELGYRFVDTDQRIEAREKKRIPLIFSEDGEDYFRKVEAEVVEAVSALDGYVISTGGGVPLKAGNLQALQKNGLLVTLVARPEVVLRRVQRRMGERPLLKGPDPLGAITRLLSEREACYGLSQFRVDTSDIPIAESVRRVLAQLPDSFGSRS